MSKADKYSNMKKFFSLYILALCFCTGAFSQYVLKTPDGKTVKLNKNGTWEYVDTKNAKEKAEAVTVPKSSSAKYTSKFKKHVVFYNPSEWKVDTSTSGYGVVIEQHCLSI